MNSVSDTIIEQQERRLPGELSAEAARDIVLKARAEFTATAGAEGRRAALKTFNSRVSNWANQFTDKRLKRFAWTLGTAMNGETHSFHVTIEKLRRQHMKLHPDAHVNKRTGKPKMLSGRQIQRYVEAFEAAGIAEVARPVQDERGDYPNAHMANVYTVRFDRVLRDGTVCVHDFMAPDQRNDRENVLRDVTRDVRRDVTRDVRSTCSSTGSPTSSPTASSSGQSPDDEAVISGESEERSSARVDGGAAQDDHTSPGDREDGQPSSAAPPGGGAPAAVPSLASRAERELDAFEELAQDLVKHYGSKFRPHLLLHRFRRIAEEMDVSADVVDQAVAWWLGGYACAAGFKDMDWDDMPNPGGYLHRILPDLIEAYLEARDAKAAELGENPDEFILCGWLRDKDEATERAESEIEEQQLRPCTA